MRGLETVTVSQAIIMTGMFMLLCAMVFVVLSFIRAAIKHERNVLDTATLQPPSRDLPPVKEPFVESGRTFERSGPPTPRSQLGPPFKLAYTRRIEFKDRELAAQEPPREFGRRRLGPTPTPPPGMPNTTQMLVSPYSTLFADMVAPGGAPARLEGDVGD